MRIKIAIVGLVRGYPQNKKLYESLIIRNNSIYKNIVNLRDNIIDVIIFHEGNISSDDQDYIKSHSYENIKFKNVSQYFINNNDLELLEKNKFNLGYRQMCRFNMYHIWEEVKEYDYILRVDEDVEITKFDPYVFEYMESKNIKYMTGRFSKEIHKLSNETLVPFLKEFTNLNIKKTYDHKFPYTNLYSTSVKFWRSEENIHLLKKIALSDEQIVYRWGDIPVLGNLLNHNNEKIFLFPKLEYKHVSHDLIIKNNYLRNLTVNSKFNPISIRENMFIKLKIYFKKKLKNINQPY